MRRSRGRRGFTLIELLVVIVIVLLLAALLLPALLKALCTARAGVAKHLIDNLTQAAKTYELDNNAYPAGDGSNSGELYDKLQKSGPKKMPYFEFLPEMYDTATKDILNPVYPDGDPPTKIIYYRNNVKPPGAGTDRKSTRLNSSH